jgi:hypothetical protein
MMTVATPAATRPRVAVTMTIDHMDVDRMDVETIIRRDTTVLQQNTVPTDARQTTP